MLREVDQLDLVMDKLDHIVADPFNKLNSSEEILSFVKVKWTSEKVFSLRLTQYWNRALPNFTTEQRFNPHFDDTMILRILRRFSTLRVPGLHQEAASVQDHLLFVRCGIMMTEMAMMSSRSQLCTYTSSGACIRLFPTGLLFSTQLLSQ